MIQALQGGNLGAADVVDVGEPGDVGDAVGGGVPMAVRHLEVLQRRAVECEAVGERARFEHGAVPVAAGREKGVVEALADVGQGGGAAVNRYAALLLVAKAAQIVDAVEVVGVRVGVEHAVDARQLLAQGLAAKIGAGVDLPALAADIEPGAATAAAVFRVGAGAHGAGAADGGGAGGAAAAEHGQADMGHDVWVLFYGRGRLKRHSTKGLLYPF